MYPQMVGEIKAGEDTDETIKGTDQAKLIPVLTKAVQELSEKLDAAMDRIAELEKNN